MRHLRQRRTGWMAGPLAAFVVVMVSMLSGCGASVATGGAPQSRQNTPGPVIPTATPIIATPIATWNGQCRTREMPQGWTWYQDARYPFHVAAPPVWRTGNAEYIPDGSGALSSPSRIHVVDFGPGSVGQATIER